MLSYCSGRPGMHVSGPVQADICNMNSMKWVCDVATSTRSSLRNTQPKYTLSNVHAALLCTPTRKSPQAMSILETVLTRSAISLSEFAAFVCAFSARFSMVATEGDLSGKGGYPHRRVFRILETTAVRIFGLYCRNHNCQHFWLSTRDTGNRLCRTCPLEFTYRNAHHG